MKARSITRFAIAVLASTAGWAIAQTSGPATQSSDWQKTVAAARSEGSVMVYGNASAALIDRITADFEKTYPGMKLEYARLPGAALYNRFDADRKAGLEGADIVLSTEVVWMQERAGDNWFNPPAGPAFKAWPTAYLRKGTVAVVSIEPFVIIYNTNLVKSPINGYQDLLKPEFKGRIATIHFDNSASVGWYDWLEQTQGAEFLMKYAAQNPRRFTGSAPGAQLVAAGEAAVNPSSLMSAALPLIEQGAPLKVVLPKPSFGFSYGAAIVARSKKRNSAQLLMDYLLSRRGQTTWNGIAKTVSPLMNIEGAQDASTVKAFDPAPYTADVMKARQAKLSGIFK